LYYKGWLQTHPDSPWKNLWHFANFNEFTKNILVLAHRYLDFGRLGIFIFIVYTIIKFKKQVYTKKNKELLLLAITSVLPVTIISLLAVNTFGHRYFIASFILFILLAFNLIQHYKNKTTIYIVLFTLLITGNFWIYPKRISQGWDASLAHMPYFNLRTKAIDYLYRNQISINETATFFPNQNPIDCVDLSGDKNKFSEFSGKETYVFYSNIYNLSDREYDNLENNYKLIQSFSKGLIRIDILKLKTK
jgi:hypothetical protein